MAKGTGSEGRPDLLPQLTEIFEQLADEEGRGWQQKWHAASGMAQSSISRAREQKFRWRIDQAAGVLEAYGVDLAGLMRSALFAKGRLAGKPLPAGLRDFFAHPVHGRYCDKYPEDRAELLAMASRGELDGLDEIGVLDKWVEIADRRRTRLEAILKSGVMQAEVATTAAPARTQATARIQPSARILPVETAPEPAPEDLVEVPLLGRVAAGRPIEALPDPKPVLVPRSLVQPGSRRSKTKPYALRVTGDSMVDAGIADGDTVIVRPTETATNGQIIVALIEGREATIKRFYLDGPPGPDQRVRLQPANCEHTPIIYSPAVITVQGLVVGVLK